ncbi:hypothetical protein D3C71_1360060 [compost metagenome]
MCAGMVLADRTVDQQEEGYDAVFQIARLTESSLVTRPLQTIIWLGEIWMLTCRAYSRFHQRKHFGFCCLFLVGHHPGSRTGRCSMANRRLGSGSEAW